MNAVVLSSLLFVCAADEKPPAPKLPLGKDTTYVVGPFDKYGFIDYENALNAELSKGVTAQNNAKALLILALGPAPEGGDGLPPAYFKWLDIPAPPKEGDYIVGIGTFTRTLIGLTNEQREALFEFQGRATKYPWVTKDCPPLAEWIKANEKPLLIVLEAVKRPQYYNPLCSRRKDGEPSNLIGTLLPSVQKCREIASLLSGRAMLKLGEGKTDEAWADIVACHRLGRLMTRGATLIESLVGLAICQIAGNATVAYIDRADLTSEQALKKLKELQALPKMMPVADKIGTGERMMGLDTIQNIRRGGNLDGVVPPVGADEAKAMEKIDWAPTMRTMNTFYDRSSAAMRIKDRPAREKELDAIEKELEAAAKKGRNEADLQKLIKEAGAGKAVGDQLGSILVSLLAPAVRKVQHAHDRVDQVQRNLEVALALKAYHKDAGKYPAKLADLAPKYLAAVPDDLFTGKPLIYKPEANGYLFYSVGVNGKDDGGRWYDDDPPGDDPRVKVPLPAPKKP